MIGFEATYSYNRANQSYTFSEATPEAFVCPVGTSPCGPQSVTVRVPANAHEISGDWIASIHVANIRPFALAGLGVLLNVPAGGGSNTSTDTKAVYIYGAGLDWGVLPHLGLRFQYRGNLYKAPDMTKLYTSTNAFTQTAEPMIGVYFRL